MSDYSSYPLQPGQPTSGQPLPGAVPTQPAANPVNSALLAVIVVAAGGLAFSLCLGVLFAVNNLSARSSSDVPKDRVVFFFTAHWCPACRHMEPTVRNLQGRGYNIRKVDVDSESALATKFGVRGIPTFVLLENGYEARRQVGGMDGDDLARWLE